MGVLYFWGMKYEVYNDIEADSKFARFEFLSEGHKGNIPKRIEFTTTQWPGVYNLAFGDVKENGELDDLNNSNNGDRNKILATVLRVVILYTDRYPDRWIYFKGSTEQRTRLYRMAISIYLDELSALFEFFAEINKSGNFVRFQKGLIIRGFLVKRKFIKFEL
jgi:hypothetical protein